MAYESSSDRANRAPHTPASLILWLLLVSGFHKQNKTSNNNNKSEQKVNSQSSLLKQNLKTTHGLSKYHSGGRRIGAEGEFVV